MHKSMWNMQEWENSLASRATAQCEQCWQIITDSRKKARGSSLLFWLVLLGWMMHEKYKGIAFFLFPKPKQRLEDCKAWIRACGQPHNQILDQHTWFTLARLGGGANAAPQICLFNLVYCWDLLVWWTSLLYLVHSIFKGGNPTYQVIWFFFKTTLTLSCILTFTDWFLSNLVWW